MIAETKISMLGVLNEEKKNNEKKKEYYISPRSSNCWYVRYDLQFRLKEDTDIVLRRLSFTLGSISL